VIHIPRGEALVKNNVRPWKSILRVQVSPVFELNKTVLVNNISLHGADSANAENNDALKYAAPKEPKAKAPKAV
jgi:hypothetical protein